jgi:hypothetical protein
MGRRLLLLAAGFLGWLAIAPAALAYNTQIKVTAAVPQMRIIYVDASGNIVKVAGNTAENITPKVYDVNNQEIALSDSINQQYQQFLANHDYHLQASKIYNINPLSVNLSSSPQVIEINSSNLSLGELRID